MGKSMEDTRKEHPKSDKTSYVGMETFKLKALHSTQLC